jgi:hypothetical protein
MTWNEVKREKEKQNPDWSSDGCPKWIYLGYTILSQGKWWKPHYFGHLKLTKQNILVHNVKN